MERLDAECSELVTKTHHKDGAVSHDGERSGIQQQQQRHDVNGMSSMTTMDFSGDAANARLSAYRCLVPSMAPPVHKTCETALAAALQHDIIIDHDSAHSAMDAMDQSYAYMSRAARSKGVAQRFAHMLFITRMMMMTMMMIDNYIQMMRVRWSLLCMVKAQV